MAPILSFCRPDRPKDGPVRLRSTDIKVNGRRVRVHIGGRGLPLVMIHGYTAHGRIYYLVLGLLAKYFKVIAIDLPGHGGSDPLPLLHSSIPAMALHMKRTLDVLGVRRCLLAGHSLGGIVALTLASENPAMVSVVFDINGIAGEPWDERMRSIRRCPVKGLPLVASLGGDIVRMLRSLGSSDQSRSLLRLARGAFSHPHRLALPGLAIIFAEPSVPVLEKLNSSHVSVVVIHGESDPIVTLEDARSTARISGGHLITVAPTGDAPSGHCWLLEDRRTLPRMLEANLREGRPLNQLLFYEVERSVNPRFATKVMIEGLGTYYSPGALVLELTPPLEFGKCRPRVNPRVVWKHSRQPDSAYVPAA